MLCHNQIILDFIELHGYNLCYRIFLTVRNACLQGHVHILNGY